MPTQNSGEPIICAIGGLNCNEVLPLIDYSAIRDNPKIVCGYSDITALLLAIYSKSDIITFHGPTLLPQWGEYPDIFSDTAVSFANIVSPFSSPIQLSAFNWHASEFTDWSEGEAHPIKRKQFPSTGWKAVRLGKCRGHLFGGNIDTINCLLGTPYFRMPEHPLIFLEAFGMPRRGLARALEHLVQSQFFESARGLIFGRFNFDSDLELRYGDSEMFTEQWFDDLLLEKLAAYDFPILSSVDIGHTDPMHTLPIGVYTEMISDRLPSITILESPVSADYRHRA